MDAQHVHSNRKVNQMPFMEQAEGWGGERKASKEESMKHYKPNTAHLWFSTIASIIIIIAF